MKKPTSRLPYVPCAELPKKLGHNKVASRSGGSDIATKLAHDRPAPRLDSCTNSAVGPSWTAARAAPSTSAPDSVSQATHPAP